MSGNPPQFNKWMFGRTMGDVSIYVYQQIYVTMKTDSKDQQPVLEVRKLVANANHCCIKIPESGVATFKTVELATF